MRSKLKLRTSRHQIARWHRTSAGPSVQLASCHLSGTYNFEMAARFLEDMGTPASNHPDKLHDVTVAQSYGLIYL